MVSRMEQKTFTFENGETQTVWLVSDGKITKIEINYPGFIGVWIHALAYSLNLCKSSSHHLARCAAFSMGV